MRVLAVDTTTARGSVAVVGPEGVVAEARLLTGDGHSRWLLPAVESLLAGVGVELAQIDAFAVTIGPGSFTGLRVGLSSVQGLAMASGRPCVGVSALDVLAGAASSIAGDREVVAITNAFRQEVYWAVYAADGIRRAGPDVGPLDDAFARASASAAFVGDAVATERERIRATVTAAAFPEVDLYLAASLGRMALTRVASGETVPPSGLRPLYLREAAIRPSRP